MAGTIAGRIDLNQLPLRARTKVLTLGPAVTHACVDENVVAPHRVHARGPARYLLPGPVSEPEQRPRL